MTARHDRQKNSDPGSSKSDPRAHKRRPGTRAPILSVDEFKQTLLKYSSRHSKSGATFSLVSIEMANYETLVHYAGADEVVHAAASIRATLSATAREADRLTAVSTAMLLILLPETDNEGCLQFVNRLSSTLLASVRPIGQIKPFFTFRTSSAPDGPCDVQELLKGTGCMVDEHGHLVTSADTRPASGLGSLQIWLERYTALTETDDVDLGPAKSMRDNWTGQNVLMMSLSCHNEEAATESSDQTGAAKSLILRARALQAFDHPAVQRLMDFFIEDSKFFAIIEPVRGSALFAETMMVSDEELITYGLDLASILIQAQSMVPSMVLPFSEQFFHYTEENRLILGNFHAAYLIPPRADGSAPEPDNLRTLARFLNELTAAQTSPVAKRLKEIAASIEDATRTGSINTLHKARAAIKALTEIANA